MCDWQDDAPPSRDDPFYESQEDHSLIGVANIFLEALFYDVKLEYQVPIISQQGEVCLLASQHFLLTSQHRLLTSQHCLVMSQHWLCRIMSFNVLG